MCTSHLLRSARYEIRREEEERKRESEGGKTRHPDQSVKNHIFFYKDTQIPPGLFVIPAKDGTAHGLGEIEYAVIVLSSLLSRVCILS